VRTSSRTFDFNTFGIASVLKLHRIAVPPYQREYAWETENVDQLYDDLAFAKLEGRDYFLGTIVTIPRESENILEIIDGQQRLTTTALLLAAIRDHLKADNAAPMVVESIENEFLSTIDRARGERVPRLTLNVDDNDFFRDLLNQPAGSKVNPSRASHRLLLAAQNTARARVRKIVALVNPQQKVDVLNDWLAFLEDSASVILVKAPDGAQAYRMFETLNDRGLKTSQVDLVKSYLFGQANRRLSEAQAKWSATRRMLEEIDDEDRDINFLRHTLITTRQFTRADAVFATVQRSTRGETSSLSFLSDLEDLSRVYVATYRSDSEHWAGHLPKTLQAVRVLNKFNIKPLRPLLLAVALRLNGLDAYAGMQFLVSLSVRLLIAASTRSGSIEEGIAAVANAVYTGKIGTAKALKSALDKFMPDNRVFKEAFSQTSSTKPDYARYYLRSLESAFAGETEPWKLLNDDPTEITLEHVLPKSPLDGEWLTFPPDQVQSYSRRLGNMCLLQKTPNSNAKSLPFEAKRKLYKASPYALTSELASLQEWTPAELENRQARMAELALKAWPA
jgi:hypothetical protein